MADILASVRSYLLSKSAITAIVGQRIYFDQLKQNAIMPAMVMYIISERHDHTLSDMTGLRHTRIAIECYSTTRLQSNLLAKTAIECGIVARRGVTHDADIRGVQVEEGQRNFIEEDTAGGDDHRYVTAFDLMVHSLG